MDYLTVKEYAELVNCTVQYSRKLVRDGKVQAEQQPHPQNKKMCYRIPVSALPEEIKLRYYRKRKAEFDLPDIAEEKPVKKAVKQQKKTVSRSFEDMTEAQRCEVNLWTGIIEEWLRIRSGYGSKAKADKLYVGKCQLEHPELEISRDILYRKLRAYRENDINGLIDKRGAWNKGDSSIPNIVWERFQWCWLDENRPAMAKCYKDVLNWTEEFYPELLSEIPSLRTFRRHIEKDVEYAIKVYMRDGEKAFADRCTPHFVRMYDELEPNECWIADNHTFDIQSLDDEGNIHRLYLTGFLDAKSGVMVGWNITDSPSSQSTMLALRHAVKRFGIPKTVYFDNGREFLTHDIGGRAARKRKNEKETSLTILDRLGIEMHNAIVRNAKAKPIERSFGTVKGQFSKMFTGYCGGTILERPESLKRRIKNGELPCDHEVRSYFDAWIDGDYNLQPYGGYESKYKNMSRLDVWNSEIKSVKMAEDAELNLMLMRSGKPQKIKRNGVFVEISGEKIWFTDPEQTVMNLQKEVYVRYDPADLSSVRIYDIDDKYLFTWGCADWLLSEFIGESRERISDGEKRIRSVRKFVREQANGISAELSSEHKITMLDMSVRKAYANKNERFQIKMPTNIVPIRCGEELPKQKKAVGENVVGVEINLNRISRNAEKRKE